MFAYSARLPPSRRVPPAHNSVRSRHEWSPKQDGILVGPRPGLPGSVRREAARREGIIQQPAGLGCAGRHGVDPLSAKDRQNGSWPRRPNANQVRTPQELQAVHGPHDSPTFPRRRGSSYSSARTAPASRRSSTRSCSRQARPLPTTASPVTGSSTTTRVRPNPGTPTRSRNG